MKRGGTFVRLGAILLVLAAFGCGSNNSSSNGENGGSGGSDGGSKSGTSKTTRGSGGSSHTSVYGRAGEDSGGAGADSGGAVNGGETAQSGNNAGGVSNSLGGAAGHTGGTTSTATGAGGVGGSSTSVGQSYGVSGKVTGLNGTGLSLSLGTIGSLLVITSNGDFVFPDKVPSGASISINVTTQPSLPRQTCTVSASGTVNEVRRDVTDVIVTCSTNNYAVGGTISGLAGRGLVIKNNAGDSLTLGGNGRFAFPTKVPSGHPFTVTVETQPSEPDQTCALSGGSGIVGASDVSSVAVNCSTNSYTIAGTLTGLEGAGVVLRNNDVDDVTLSANGSFAFPTPVLSGKAFTVTVKTEPNAPAQTCEVINGTGVVANRNVASVEVRCATNTYSISGSVTGLVGNGLSLQNNLTDSLSVSANGEFSFPTKIESGSNYSVTVQNQPASPTQTCIVAAGAGVVTDEGISTPLVSCTTNRYFVGGTVTGLEGTGLVLRDNDGDDLTIDENGSFSFPVSVLSGSVFAVTVLTQPDSPKQYCRVVGGKGTVGGANVTSVTVNCSDEAHAIGGNVNGLVGSGLSLALNGDTPISVNTNGGFAFPSLITIDSSYDISITQQPSTPWQICTLTNGSGIVGSSDISDVAVTCSTNTYTVGGAVTGLTGTGLVLQNEGSDDVAVSVDGSFAFRTPVSSGNGYAITVSSQPTAPSQTCSVSNGTGKVGGSPVENVQVTCKTNLYSISGTITGLAGSVVLANNEVDTLKVTANGTFSFTGLVSSGNNYIVTVATQPNSPPQTCTVVDGSGTVVANNVTGVRVECTTNRYTIGGTVTGLSSGEKLVLQNNASDALTVSVNGTFRFATSSISGNSYDVSISSSPTSQYCTVSGGTGTVGRSNVTSITINCTSLRTIGGTVTGLTGTGFMLRNGTEDLSISGPGTFAFTKPQLDGSSYDVTVRTQPISPWQTCVIDEGKGVVTGDVKTIVVSCTSNPQSLFVNVTGLVGTGLVLQNNLADNLLIKSNGVSAFAAKVPSGQDYAVTVLGQPSTPNQTCTVSSAVGTVANVDVTLNVNCVSNNYTIGGKVLGYIGSGLVLLNNGGNPLSISATGVFAFTAPAAGGSAYAVTVGTQPSGFACGVSNGTGVVGDGNVTSVVVNCPAYTFETGTQGWGLKSVPTGMTQPVWTSSVGYPNLGALTLDIPLAANCPQIQVMVTPSTAINATGTTITAWVRFESFPNNPVSGDVTFYAQDANWSWNASTYNLSSFKVGEWKQLTLLLPASANWTKVYEVGLRVQPGGTGCQAAKVVIDSVQFQ